MPGFSSAFLAAELSLARTDGFRPLGAPIPYQDMLFIGFRPTSAKVGTLGNWGRRSGLETASARNLPPAISPPEEGMLSKTTSIWPDIRSFKAGPRPLYGTWVIWVLVVLPKSAPLRWL